MAIFRKAAERILGKAARLRLFAQLLELAGADLGQQLFKELGIHV